MTLTGKQKAAMLLMALDMPTATELLKDMDPEVVQELAVELTYLDAAGYRNSRQSLELAKEFVGSIQDGPQFHLKSFLQQMLKNTLGEERAGQVQTEIQKLVQKKDPFLPIRSANAQAIASVLAEEHPQVAAVILSELDPKKSSAVMGLFGDGVRLSVIARMTRSESVTAEAKHRIAETVCSRLEEAAGASGKSAGGTDDSLRKVAVILRNLGQDLRDGLLTAIEEENEETSKAVSRLMVVWEDIPQIADRSMQQALRGVDSGRLALALYKAEEAIVETVRANISERAAESLDEETGLMSSPKQEEVTDAREELVVVLREMNENGELMFADE